MMRSYELLARYVMPRCQGLIKPIEASAARVSANKEELMQKASGAILQAIRDYNAVHPRQK
jgi:hypothetical protein